MKVSSLMPIEQGRGGVGQLDSPIQYGGPGPAPKRKEQVAQGQYVVSDTRCPALHDCEFE